MTPQYIGQSGDQPIFLLTEGMSRSQGMDAKKNIIAAARAVADAVRTTLGPKGMDKLIVDRTGDVIVTNDGATILKEIGIEHPAAKMIVEVAKTQEKEIGDGTTTAVIVAGALLEKAEGLLDQGIHSTMILRGYQRAKEHAIKSIEKMATASTQESLESIARTAMTGKFTEFANLSSLVVEAVMLGKEADNIKIEKKTDSFLSETRLIRGILIDKEVVHHAMPTKIRAAKIALIDCPLELKELASTATISLHSPEKREAFVETEERKLHDMAKKIIAAGANVVLCQKGIDDVIQHEFARAKVIAARRVKKSDMELLVKATGARILSDVLDITSKDLGAAGLVQELQIAGDKMLSIEECTSPHAVTILVRGANEQSVAEAERGLEDAIRGVAAVLKEKRVLPGGGAPEIEAARAVRAASQSSRGKEQLVMQAFADALEVIPKTLAENGGWDALEKVALLRSQPGTGLDVFTGEACDMKAAGVLEPLGTTRQALTAACEAAEMILRIDDVLVAARSAPSAH